MKMKMRGSCFTRTAIQHSGAVSTASPGKHTDTRPSTQSPIHRTNNHHNHDMFAPVILSSGCSLQLQDGAGPCEGGPPRERGMITGSFLVLGCRNHQHRPCRRYYCPCPARARRGRREAKAADALQSALPAGCRCR